MPHPISAIIALCVPMLAVAGVVSAAPGDKATAEMQTARGARAGTVILIETPHGVLLSGEVSQLRPGGHGFHIHEVGKCEPPFTSAGGHLNPGNAKHGFASAEGPHAGDLPNLHAGSDGQAVVDAFAPGVTMTELLDADGSSLVVHEKMDDYRTDPAGDSGGRILCGIVQKTM